MPIFSPDDAWGRCLSSFLNRSGYSDATVISYTGILDRFFSGEGWNCPPRLPDAYTRENILDFMYHKSGKAWNKHKDGTPSVATINKRYSTLSSFYTYAATYVPSDATEPLFQRPSPTLGMKLGTSERAPRGISYDELSRLFAVIPSDTLLGIRDKAIFTFAFWSARRRSELSELVYGDIQPASFPDGQGGIRQGFVYYFRGKGKKSIRDCQELPQPAKDAIDWYIIASGRIDDIQPDSPLFASVGRPLGMGGNVKPGEIRRLTSKGIAQALKKYVRLAGLSNTISLHSFRHASAKARHEQGEDILSIQSLLRHSSLQTTFIYLHQLSGGSDNGASLLQAKYGQL